MNRFSVLTVLLLGVGMASGLTGCAQQQSSEAPAELVDHPSLLERHSLESRFPRFTTEQLAAAGYPDHGHTFVWPDWQVMVDRNGDTYGPGSLCQEREVVPRTGLVVEPGRIRYRSFNLEFDSRYAACDMMPFVEMLDWARHDLQTMLGIVREDTLHIINTNSSQDYLLRSGLGTWRMYKMVDGSALMQAIAVLYARGLPVHAAFELVVEWTLRGVCGDALPLWFERGLMEYMSENGCHLTNYMGPYRSSGPVLLAPDRVDAILAAPPNSDRGIDNQEFRMACYSAFIMVWELIENRGGLQAVERFLADVASGESVDTAARKVWRADLTALRGELDATRLGEPIGDATQPRAPHRPPEPPEPPESAATAEPNEAAESTNTQHPSQSQ